LPGPAWNEETLADCPLRGLGKLGSGLEFDHPRQRRQLGLPLRIVGWPVCPPIRGIADMGQSTSIAITYAEADDSAALLRILDDLAYVIECASLDYMGEGRFELDRLCERMQADPDYRIAEGDQVVGRLREALALYRNRGGDYPQGHSRLMSTSRELWKRIHPHQIS
jgi:hypothetical protein